MGTRGSGACALDARSCSHIDEENCQALIAMSPTYSPTPQAIFTLLPLRVGLALLALGRALLSRGGSTDSEAAAGDGAAGSSSSSSGRRSTGLRGDQLFDILSAAMSLGVVVFLWNLNAGTLYFWMKVGQGGWLGGWGAGGRVVTRGARQECWKERGGGEHWAGICAVHACMPFRWHLSGAVLLPARLPACLLCRT